MLNNTNLSHDLNANKNQTYFIHIKKNDLINTDIYTLIKKIIDPINTNNINNTDIKIMTNLELANIKLNNIGKFIKSNKTYNCVKCNTEISSGTIFKKLNCKHRFHIKCINLELKKDIYKKCIYCKTEHISICD